MYVYNEERKIKQNKIKLRMATFLHIRSMLGKQIDIDHLSESFHHDLDVNRKVFEQYQLSVRYEVA